MITTTREARIAAEKSAGTESTVAPRELTAVRSVVSPWFSYAATSLTSYADTNATGPGPFFYRVGVTGP